MSIRLCAVGLDLGTTSVKAVAYTEDERIIGQMHAPVVTLHPVRDSAEQDPNAVLAAVVSVLRAIAQQTRDAGYTIEQIGISAAVRIGIAPWPGSPLLPKSLVVAAVSRLIAKLF